MLFVFAVKKNMLKHFHCTIDYDLFQGLPEIYDNEFNFSVWVLLKDSFVI